MSELWAISMLISGGLFTGGVVSIAWERIPAWRESELLAFRPAFAHTLRRMDRLQPALLSTCLASTIGFAIGSGGVARAFAVVAAAGFLLILAGSGAWLVPIQKRLVASAAEEPSPEVERLKRQWLRGRDLRGRRCRVCLAHRRVGADTRGRRHRRTSHDPGRLDRHCRADQQRVPPTP